jgi:4'-phosphopantetheinyl transferase
MSGPAAAGERVGLLLAPASEVPGGDEWLAPEELETLAGLRMAKRRAEWRLGRWTAKRAVAVFLGVDPGSVVIAAAPDGAPEATVGGAPAPCALSLSHRAGLAACAVADLHVAVGCDLEAVEPRTPEFVTDYLTSGEAAAVRAAPTDERDLLANLVWSAKESVLKATRTGLRADTRSVEILLGSGGNGSEWTSFAARRASDPTPWAGWWRRIDEHVVTVAARPDPAEPAELRS